MDRSRQTHEPPTQALPPKPRPSFRYQPRRYSKARDGTPNTNLSSASKESKQPLLLRKKKGTKFHLSEHHRNRVCSPARPPFLIWEIRQAPSETGRSGPAQRLGRAGGSPAPHPPSTARGVQPISLKNRNRESCGSARGGIAVDRSGENLASCRGRGQGGWKPTALALVPRAALLMSTHSSPLSSPTERGSKGLPAGELGVLPQGRSHTQRNPGFTGGADHGAARGRLVSGVPPGKFP